jgi:putative oxygen-independent coproporphyrinogen III oxidase
VSKCPYCDFNSHVGQQHLHRAYMDRLRAEIAAWGRELDHGELDTVFIGGGTPSLVPAEEISRLLDAVRDAFQLRPGAEVTIEANPQSAEAARMESWLDAGVNRLSLGVQSLDDGTLRFLERAHDREEARRVMRQARGAGFRSVSFDLIFAVPGLSTERWESVLQEALAFAPDHLSAYELTPEPGTRLGADVAAGRTVLPDDDTRIEQYELAGTALAAAGLRRYEVSNWSRAGHRCQHNLAYWSGLPYAAAGAGAHAFGFAGAAPSWLGDAPAGAVTVRHWNVSSPAAYIAAVRAHGNGTAGSEWLDLPTSAADLLMMGLRLDAGLDLPRAEAVMPGFLDHVDPVARRFEAGGLLTRSGGRLSATDRGRVVLNQVIADFLPPAA